MITCDEKFIESLKKTLDLHWELIHFRGKKEAFGSCTIRHISGDPSSDYNFAFKCQTCRKMHDQYQRAFSYFPESQTGIEDNSDFDYQSYG